MDLDRLREIIDLVADSGVSEIEIEEDGVRIMVRKDPPAAAVPIQTVIPTTPTEQASESKTKSTAPAGTEVRAPIVGTFYVASSPEADPFVSVGDQVEPGDILCIIEAMKLMNEIESEVSGTVKKVLVENASPIEFDQPLFIIEEN